MKRTASYLTHTLRKCNLPIFTMAVVLGLTTCSSHIFAQSGAGSIQGTVADSTGAVIPGAAVHAVNQATGVSADTKSNSVGFYQVPGLFTGTYIVTYSAPGMKTDKATVELLVDQHAVVNPVLTAGPVTTQVEVSSDIVQLTTTDSGTIAATLENSRINQLPMNGRNILTLAGMTAPGVEGGQRANGLFSEALEYVIDGMAVSNRQFGGESSASQATLPDPDAVQEVRIESTNTGAQYSEPGTAIVSIKSGTNSLHGSFFETARNNAIGIAKGRQNPANYAAPHLVRNEFGGSAGGPVILPHVYHGKNKTFWFFAYERYSQAAPTNELVTVPMAGWRTGDFSQLITSAGVLQQLYDPATTTTSANCNGTGVANNYCRAPFTNNQIPIGRLAPTTKIMYDITPKPTSTAIPLSATNYTAVNPTFVRIPTITFRLDHSFNEKNRVYLRYTNNDQFNEALRNYPSNSAETIAADGFPQGASGYQLIPITNFSGAIGYSHVFSPTFFSETIVGQQWQQMYTTAGGNPNLDYEQMLGIPNNFGEAGFPNFGANLIMPYGGTQFNYGMSFIVSNIDENLVKVAGRHQMQFGARYRHERFGSLPDRTSDSVTFTNETSGLELASSGANYSTTANTGYQDADFFLGSATTYQVTLEPPYEHFHDMEFDGYFQDNFHVSKSLTVNLGLCYEAHPAPWMKDGLTEGFDFKNKAVVLTNPISSYIAKGYTTQPIVNNLENIGVVFESPAQAGYPSAMIDNYDFIFAPRVGLAYQPSWAKHGTVLRGAYGRYVYPIPVRNSLRGPVTGPPFEEAYSQSYTSAAQSPDGLPNYLVRNPQPVIMGTNSSNVVNTSTTNSILPGINLWNIAPNYAPDMVTQVNATVEQPLMGNSALRITWLWCHGQNLDHYFYYNYHPSTYVWEVQNGIVPPTGGASTIGTAQYANTGTGPYDKITYGSSTLEDVKDGWSNDNALQATYQRLFHRGIAYQITYVWSKPMRFGGNYFRDGNIYPYADFVGNTSAVAVVTPFAGGVITPPYLPPHPPTGTPAWAEYHDLNRYEAYIVDTAIPKQHIQFNGIVDLPFGRGKRIPGQR